MAVKASNSITVYDQTDVLKVTTFYQRVSSTANPPAAPTTTQTSAAVTGWSTTMPAYGSSYRCYKVERSERGDGTCVWGTVTEDQAWTGANGANSTATDAQTTANAASNKVDNLSIGGRNLLRWTSDPSGHIVTNAHTSAERGWCIQSGGNGVGTIEDVTDSPVDGVSKSFRITGNTSGNRDWQQQVPDFYYKGADGNWTLTVYVRGIGGSVRAMVRVWSQEQNFLKTTSVGTDWTLLEIPISLTSNVSTIGAPNTSSSPNLLIGMTGAGSIEYIAPMLVSGTVMSDYAIAPEDLAAASRAWYAECPTADGAAAKVATITPATTAFTLTKGQRVAVFFSATNTEAVGSITLNVNGTGAKAIKYLANGAKANLPAANYLRANQIVDFVYDGSNWVADFSYNANNYDRRLHNNYVKAAGNVTSGALVCGTSAGYVQVAANAVFDLTYPILWAGAAWTSGTQYANAYEAYPSVQIATTLAVANIPGIAANKMVYLKGTVDGNQFAVAASNFLTCTAPTTEDGFCYIPVGVLGNDYTSSATNKLYFASSKELYAYKDGAFGPISMREASAVRSTVDAALGKYTGVLSGAGTPDTATDAWTGPLIGATVDGLSTQDGTPTPSAPVAIKSVEGAAALVAGRNFFTFPQAKTGYGVTVTPSNGGATLNVSGTATYQSVNIYSTDSVIEYPVPAGTYRLTVGGFSNNTLAIRVSVTSGGTVVGRYDAKQAAPSVTFSVPDDSVITLFVRIQLTAATNETLNVMLSYGSETVAWEPYVAPTTTAILPSTAAPLRSLPDGTHDELTVNRDGTVTVVRKVGSVTVDGSSVSVDNVWTAASYPLFGVTIPASKASTSSSAMSDRFTATDSSQIWNGGSSYAGKFATNAETTRNLRLRLADSSITTVAAANTWFASNPSTFFYPLATPTTETLPSVTMPTVPSRNLTAWVDATDADGAAIAAPWEMFYHTADYEDSFIEDIDGAAKVATNYVTETSNGVKVHPEGDDDDYAYISPDGLEVFDGGVSVAAFGSTTRVGTSSGARVVATSNGIDIYNSSNQKKASYGSTQYIYGGSGTYPYVMTSSSGAYLYQSANNHADITSSGLEVFKDGASVAAFSGTTARVGRSNKQRVDITSSAIEMYDENNAITSKFDSTGTTLYYGGSKRASVTSSGLGVYNGQTELMTFGTFVDGNVNRASMRSEEYPVWIEGKGNVRAAVVVDNGLSWRGIEVNPSHEDWDVVVYDDLKVGDALTATTGKFLDSVGVEATGTPTLSLTSKGYKGKIGDDVPSSNAVISREKTYDSSNSQLFYTEIVRTTADELYKSFVLQRKNASNTELYHGFYLRIQSNGTMSVTFPNTTSKNAFASGIVGGTTTNNTNQIGSLGSGVTVTSVVTRKNPCMCSVQVKFKKSSAIAANSSVTVGTLTAGNRPVGLDARGVADQTDSQVRVSTAGVVTFYNGMASSIAANTEITVYATFAL